MYINDKYVLVHALNMWANHIETGNVTMDACTAYRLGENYNALDTGQIDNLNRIKKLADDILTDKKVLNTTKKGTL